MKRNHRWNIINNYLNNERSCFIIGGGTSLKGFNLSLLDKEFTIAVNHSIEHYPQASALLFGDKIFLHKTTFDLTTYEGLIFCSEGCSHSEPLQNMIPADNVFVFETLRDDPIMNAKKGLFHPTSSGIMAINLALQMKAKKIYLLGFDYYKVDGQMHWYEDYNHHKTYKEEKLQMKLKKFKNFDDKMRGKVINLNPDSSIVEFQKMDWRELFKGRIKDGL